jgi:putative FmdB family regulatory protein
MPLYEYECTRCGHTFEIEQRMTDPPRKRCPECRGKVERVISGPLGILFKGSGFYTTDYRSPEYRKKEKAEREAMKKARGDSAKKDSAKKPSSGDGSG